jgi:tetratricopeptide (TPR) repeat protein
VVAAAVTRTTKVRATAGPRRTGIAAAGRRVIVPAVIPVEIDALFARAEHLCEIGRWAEAERALGAVLAVDPEHFDALCRLTEVLEHLDRPEEAAEVARWLIAGHPDEADGYLALAEALAVQGQHADAEGHVRTALGLDPDAPLAWQQLAEVLGHLPGREEEAVAAARQAVALAPHDADAHAEVGDALLRTGDGPGAQAAYLAALGLAPQDGNIRLRLGLARLQVGRLDDAVADFVAGLAQGPTARHIRGVGRVLHLLGVPERYPELYGAVCLAMGRSATVDRADPEVVEGQLDLAVTWWDNGARAAAVELLELLVEANPEAVDGLATLAEFRFESGRPDDAEALARRAVAVDPQAAAALFVLGLVGEGRGDGAGAAQWFDRLRAVPVDAQDRQWMLESLTSHGLAGRHPELVAWCAQTAGGVGAAAGGAVGFSQSAPPASEASIRRLEQRIGQPLPAAYHEFLRQRDGGPLERNDRAVDEIYGLRDDVPDFASIWPALELYRDQKRVPAWLLPVARDCFGNLFALSLREQDRGAVWFWDHGNESDEGEPPAEDNITLVAPHWRAFLDCLEPVDLSQIDDDVTVTVDH